MVCPFPFLLIDVSFQHFRKWIHHCLANPCARFLPRKIKRQPSQGTFSWSITMSKLFASTNFTRISLYYVWFLRGFDLKKSLKGLTLWTLDKFHRTTSAFSTSLQWAVRMASAILFTIECRHYHFSIEGMSSKLAKQAQLSRYKWNLPGSS